MAVITSENIDAPGGETFGDHVQTYRTFVKLTFVFVAHVAVILALMTYFLT